MSRWTYLNLDFVDAQLKLSAAQIIKVHESRNIAHLYQKVSQACPELLPADNEVFVKNKWIKLDQAKSVKYGPSSKHTFTFDHVFMIKDSNPIRYYGVEEKEKFPRVINIELKGFREHFCEVF